MANAKLTKEQRQEIADRFVAGETVKVLAEEFEVCINTITRVCRDLHAIRPQPRPATIDDLGAFASRAKSILWAQDHGKDHPAFDAWKARVEELKSNSGLTKNQATVRASKEFPCLSKLFREFDVRKYDPNPESHAHIRHFGEAPPKNSQVRCEGIDQSYRDSLRWAMDAAGRTDRTGERPASCPCDRAWYLYIQAVNDTKDFLTRVGQVESKGDAESEERRSARAAGERSIAEIDGFLAELEHEREEEDA